MRRHERWEVKRVVFPLSVTGEWVQVQASSAVGPLVKIRPVEETITDK